MTSFAFILGCVPLWIATGSGAASRRILGTVVVSGMLAATALAIFIIPAVCAHGAVGQPLHAQAHDSGRLRRRSKRKPDMRALTVLLIAGAAAGCTVGPDYKRPIVTVPDAYRGAAAPESAAADPSSIGDQAWWTCSGRPTAGTDPTALQQNLDLRIAATRILEAQAQLGITRADQFPNRRRRCRRVAQPGRETVPQSRAIRTRIATSSSRRPPHGKSLLGQVPARDRSARASLLASEWGRRAVATSLVGQSRARISSYAPSISSSTSRRARSHRGANRCG